MNITFSFQNGTSKIHLTPQNARDERYLELCIDGKPDVKLCAGKDKELIIGFSTVTQEVARVEIPSEKMYQYLDWLKCPGGVNFVISIVLSNGTIDVSLPYVGVK